MSGWAIEEVEVKPKKKRRRGKSRKEILRTKRLKLLLEDPYCHYCGHKLEVNHATVDHKKPRSKGGNNDDDNIVLACKQCNNLKGDMSYEEFRDRIILQPPRPYTKKYRRRVRLLKLPEKRKLLLIEGKKTRRKTNKNSTIDKTNTDEALTAELNRLLSLLS